MVCKSCGMIFDKTESGRTKFCSVTCMRKWHDKTRNAIVSQKRNLQGVCEECHKVFQKKRTSQKFCNSKCKEQYQNRLRRSTTVYEKQCSFCGQMFKSVLRRQKLCGACYPKRSKGFRRASPVLRKDLWERQEHRCWLCNGLTELSDVVLHHLDASGHKAKPNNNPENLVALHKRCHTMFHRPHIVFRDGVWGVDGRILDYLEVGTMKVMKTDRDLGA